MREAKDPIVERGFVFGVLGKTPCPNHPSIMLEPGEGCFICDDYVAPDPVQIQAWICPNCLRQYPVETVFAMFQMANEGRRSTDPIVPIKCQNKECRGNLMPHIHPDFTTDFTAWGVIMVVKNDPQQTKLIRSFIGVICILQMRQMRPYNGWTYKEVVDTLAAGPDAGRMALVDFDKVRRAAMEHPSVLLGLTSGNPKQTDPPPAIEDNEEIEIPTSFRNPVFSNKLRRLQKRKEQQALSGANTDPEVLIEIEDLTNELKAEARRLLNVEIDLRKLRIWLTETTDDDELRRFCRENPDFKPVASELAQGTGHAAIIDKLIEYAERKSKIEIMLNFMGSSVGQVNRYKPKYY